MKRLAPYLLFFFMFLTSIAIAEDYVVDDFENGVGNWAHFPWSFYPEKDYFYEFSAYAYEGDKSMAMLMMYGREDKVYHAVETDAPFTDISGYDSISCQCRTLTAYGPQFYYDNNHPAVGLKIVLMEENGEIWQPPDNAFTYIPGEEWVKAEYPISNFSVCENTVSGDGVFNPENIAKIRIFTFAQTNDYAMKLFLIDAVTLHKSDAPPPDVLDDFEAGILGWSSWPSISNYTAIAHETDAANVKMGTGSLKFTYRQGLEGPEPGYTNEFYRRYATASLSPYWKDYSAYSGISYWVKSEHDDTNRIHLVLTDENGVEWQQLNRVVATSGWQQVNVWFERDIWRGFGYMGGGSPDDEFDVDNIQEIKFRVDKEMYGAKGDAEHTNTVFYIDDVRLITETPPVFIPEPAPVLFNFENNDIGLWKRFSDEFTTMDISSDDPHGGDRCMQLRFEQGVSGTNWAQRLATCSHSNPIPDWTGYKQITAWIKESQYSTNTCAITLTETNGQKWIQRIKLISTDTWEQIRVPLYSKWDDSKGFDLNGVGEGESGTNGVLDLNMISDIGFEFNKGITTPKTPSWTSVYVDDVALSVDAIPQYASMSVTDDQIAFGDVTPTENTFRFLSLNSATVSWETSGMNDTAWGLYVYTTDPNGKQGLKGETHTDFYVPLRWWTGPDKETPPPDLMTQSVWTNEFGHVLDQYDPDLNPMLTTEGEVAAGALGSFELHFAADISDGAAIQTYSSQITIELRIDN